MENKYNNLKKTAKNIGLSTLIGIGVISYAGLLTCATGNRDPLNMCFGLIEYKLENERKKVLELTNNGLIMYKYLSSTSGYRYYIDTNGDYKIDTLVYSPFLNLEKRKLTDKEIDNLPFIKKI